MSVRCDDCGTPMIPLRKDYRYVESGLDHVLLKGARVHRCPACKAEAPEIPNLLGLHQQIAKALLTKPALLTGPEIRFLRKHLGLKAAEFAAHLGTTNVTVSRWETEEIGIDARTDRLIRLLAVRKLEEEAGQLLLKGLYDRIVKMPASPARPIKITILPRQLGKRAVLASAC